MILRGLHQNSRDQSNRKNNQQNSHTPIQHGKCVAVVGGGNVAMDAARTARRLGAEVHIIYRRGEEELPARREEIEHAKEEGIIFDLLTNPTQILPTPVEDKKSPFYGWVSGIECVKMELGQPDESGRRSPKVIAGSEFIIPVDCVIMSLGTSPNPLLKATTPGLETLRRGHKDRKDFSTLRAYSSAAFRHSYRKDDMCRRIF